MRILMIKGASFNREVPQYSYPLGLLYLASYLRERDPHVTIELLDLRCHRNPFDVLQGRLQEFRPDVVAISALTCEADSLHMAADLSKKWDEESVVIVGGPHISACTDDVVDDENIDILVIGEGEATFAEIIAAIGDGAGSHRIAGAGWRGPEGIIWGEQREPIEPIDTIPFPAWDLVDIDVYARYGRPGNLRRGRFLPLFTSRGCPYQCFYCHNLFGKRFRARSAEDVLAEVGAIVDRYGIDDLEIYDDIFNLDLDRAKRICRGLIAMNRSFKISFPNGVRADRLDAELIELLAEAGTTNLAVAVETASPRLQKKIHKNLALERVKEAVTWADKAGIVTNGYFMIGFPSETAEEIKATIDYAVKTDLHFASFFIVTPYPGTSLWEDVMKSHDSSDIDFKTYNFFSGYFNLSEVSPKELRRLQRDAYLRFYMRKAPKLALALPRLRIDWRNAAWLWFRRMADRGYLRKSDRMPSGT